MPNHVLTIYAHPAPNRSRVNRYLADKAGQQDYVQLQDLYELYPDFHIDVAIEQQMIRQARALVFQFPLYWYSAPALLKEWCDTVLASGFAHGEGEKVLAGKKFMVSVTTGGSAEAYQKGQIHGDAIDTFLSPFHQLARFCDMQVAEPFIIHDAGNVGSDKLDQLIIDYEKHLEELKG